MIIVLSKEHKEYLIWFKPEILQTINWAGNPEKPVLISPDNVETISPRNSFEAWSQTVYGISLPWTLEEIESVQRLKEEILYVINLKAGAIKLLNEKLRQAYEELDTFSYTVSHDLKNPIAAIKGYAELLERNNSIGQQAQKIAGRIGERITKMNFLINAVLDYAHLGRLDINYKRINAKVLIEDIVNDLDLEHNPEKLIITINELPDLYGDRVMMSQVFTNLISNAIKYSRNASPAIINISATDNENEILYSIKDNGLGILQKDLHIIFDLFNRMENARQIEGSGVGLAIVKRIVEKHNGRLWVESIVGEGSVFYVAFKKELPIMNALDIN